MPQKKRLPKTPPAPPSSTDDAANEGADTRTPREKERGDGAEAASSIIIQNPQGEITYVGKGLLEDDDEDQDQN